MKFGWVLNDMSFLPNSYHSYHSAQILLGICSDPLGMCGGVSSTHHLHHLHHDNMWTCPPSLLDTVEPDSHDDDNDEGQDDANVIPQVLERSLITLGGKISGTSCSGSSAGWVSRILSLSCSATSGKMKLLKVA